MGRGMGGEMFLFVGRGWVRYVSGVVQRSHSAIVVVVLCHSSGVEALLQHSHLMPHQG